MFRPEQIESQETTTKSTLGSNFRGKCFGCGQMGHRKFECPVKDQPEQQKAAKLSARQNQGASSGSRTSAGAKDHVQGGKPKPAVVYTVAGLELVKTQFTASQERQVRNARTSADIVYEKGDYVWLHHAALSPGLSRKLGSPWRGPYRVLKCYENSTFRVKLVQGGRTQRVHYDRLKPCVFCPVMEVGDKPPAVERLRNQPVGDPPTGISGDPHIVHLLDEVREVVQAAEYNQSVEAPVVLGGRPARGPPLWLADYVSDLGQV